jgi:hypothetical protein
VYIIKKGSLFSAGTLIVGVFSRDSPQSLSVLELDSKIMFIIGHFQSHYRETLTGKSATQVHILTHPHMFADDSVGGPDSGGGWEC